MSQKLCMYHKLYKAFWVEEWRSPQGGVDSFSLTQFLLSFWGVVFHVHFEELCFPCTLLIGCAEALILVKSDFPKRTSGWRRFCQATTIKVNNDNGSRCEEQGCFVTSSPCTGFWPTTLGDRNNRYLKRSEIRSNCLGKSSWNYQKDLYPCCWHQLIPKGILCCEILANENMKPSQLENCFWDFPDCPVAKTRCSQLRGPGFDHWSGNEIPRAATKSLNVAIKRLQATTKIEILCAATKTWLSKIKKKKRKEKKSIRKYCSFHLNFILSKICFVDGHAL